MREVGSVEMINNLNSKFIIYSQYEESEDKVSYTLFPSLPLYPPSSPSNSL